MDYFVIQKNGPVLHFLKNNQGICFCALSNRRLGAYNVLLKDGQDDFDVAIDEYDYIHILCQNSHSDIVHLIYDGNEWERKVLLESKHRDPYTKNFRIIVANDKTHGFYTIKYEGKIMLAHSVLSGENEKPDVVDYINNDGFCAAQTDKGDIYIYYVKDDGVSGMRKLRANAGQFGAFIPIEGVSGLTQTNLFVHQAGVIHIIGTQGGKVMHYVIVESRNHEFMNNATISRKITHSDAGSNPVIFRNRDDLWVLWESKKTGRIVAARTKDNGIKWHKNTEFVAPNFTSSKRINLRYCIQNSAISAFQTYGFLSQNTVTLYIINNIFLQYKPRKPDADTVSFESETSRNSELPPHENLVESKIEYTLRQAQKQLIFINNKVTDMSNRINEIENKLDDLYNNLNRNNNKENP